MTARQTAGGERKIELARGRSYLTGLILSRGLDPFDPHPFPARHSDWMVLGFLSRSEAALYNGDFTLGRLTLYDVFHHVPLIPSRILVAFAKKKPSTLLRPCAESCGSLSRYGAVQRTRETKPADAAIRPKGRAGRRKGSAPG